MHVLKLAEVSGDIVTKVYASIFNSNQKLQKEISAGDKSFTVFTSQWWLK